MELKELNAVLTYVMNAECSFYRDLYGNSPVSCETWEQWHAIPMLSIGDIEKIPLEKRLFMPLSEIEMLRSSSGTTGKPPVFFPRARIEESYTYNIGYHSFGNPGLCAGPLTGWGRTMHLERALHLAVSLDPDYVRTSVELAVVAGFDSMDVTPALMPLVSEELKRLKYEDKIGYVQFSGAGSALSVMKSVLETFPHATLMSQYGISEAGGGLSDPCAPTDTSSQNPEIFHAARDVYMELVNTETGAHVEPHEGAEGELIVTIASGGAAAFPLLRYRTRDLVKIVKEKCEKHGVWAFAVLGRIDAEYVKVPGGMLRADEIERTLRSIFPVVSDTFVATYELRDTAPYLRLTLDIEPREKDLSRIAGLIAEGMRLNTGFTYADGVAQGVYAPLICKVLQRTTERKRLRLVKGG